MALCGAMSRIWKAPWGYGKIEDDMGFQDLNSGEDFTVRLKGSYCVNGSALHAKGILLQSDGFCTAHFN